MKEGGVEVPEGEEERGEGVEWTSRVAFSVNFRRVFASAGGTSPSWNNT